MEVCAYHNPESGYIRSVSHTYFQAEKSVFGKFDGKYREKNKGIS